MNKAGDALGFKKDTSASKDEDDPKKSMMKEAGKEVAKAGKEAASQAAKAAWKAFSTAAKAILQKLAVAISGFLVHAWPVILVVIAVVAVVFIIIAIFTAISFTDNRNADTNNLKALVTSLGENAGEFMKVEGNNDTGYYYEFKDDIDDKLKKYVQDTVTTYGQQPLETSDEEIETLKLMLKAELVTQLPDLRRSTKL